MGVQGIDTLFHMHFSTAGPPFMVSLARRRCTDERTRERRRRQIVCKNERVRHQMHVGDGARALGWCRAVLIIKS